MSRWRVVVVGRRWLFGGTVTAVRYEADPISAWERVALLTRELRRGYGARRFESSVTKEQ